MKQEQPRVAFSWDRFVDRRLSELRGFLLLTVSVFFFLSLVSWSSEDPGIHRAVTVDRHQVGNMGGFLGAYMADVLFWALGLVAFPCVVFPAKVGLYHVCKKKFHWSRLRLVSLMFVPASMGIFLSCLSRDWFPIRLGGLLGGELHALLQGVFGLPFIFEIAISGLVSALGLCALFGKSRNDEPLNLGLPRPSGLLLSITGFRTRLSSLVLRSCLGVKQLGVFLPKAVGRSISRILSTLVRGISFLIACARRFQAAVHGDSLDDGATLGKEHHPRETFDGTASAEAYEIRKAVEISNLPPSSPSSQPIISTYVPEKRDGFRAFSFRRKDQDRFLLPPVDLLSLADETDGCALQAERINQTAGQLERVLGDFGVQGRIVRVNAGPVVTLYELEPSPGTKSSRVISLSDDIARSMSTVSARVAIVPGRNIIGIELPNIAREKVFLRTLFETEQYCSGHFKLPLALGKSISGAPLIADLTRMPHLLVAGTTGSGKSVSINSMILSLLYSLTPDMCKLILIDPKMLELSVYDGIPHLLAPVVTEPKKAIVALKWVVKEMGNRYRFMAGEGVRNISVYNQRIESLRKKDAAPVGADGSVGSDDGSPSLMPYIVVVIDEMADLMMVAGKEIEAAVQRLAQMARAAGIHMIMATQRPSVDVITGTIKANFPTRISFQVTSKIDSRTILGEQGAEQLLGQGDMLYMMGGGRIVRLHGPFVSDQEIEDTVVHLRSQDQRPDYIEEVTQDDGSGAFSTSSGEGDDDLYQRAVEVVLRDQKPSISYIQRRLQIGYNSAARLMEMMEAHGIVSPQNHQGKREILTQ